MNEMLQTDGFVMDGKIGLQLDDHMYEETSAEKSRIRIILRYASVRDYRVNRNRMARFRCFFWKTKARARVLSL